MAAIFGKINIFFENPVGQKFRPNRSISHGFQDISIFVVSLLENLQ